MASPQRSSLPEPTNLPRIGQSSRGLATPKLASSSSRNLLTKSKQKASSKNIRAPRYHHSRARPTYVSGGKQNERSHSNLMAVGMGSLHSPRTLVKKSQEREDLARTMFMMADVHQNGYVARGDFEALVRVLHGSASRGHLLIGEESFNHMLKREFDAADKDHNGMVEFNEFVDFYNHFVNFEMYRLVVSGDAGLEWNTYEREHGDEEEGDDALDFYTSTDEQKDECLKLAQLLLSRNQLTVLDMEVLHTMLRTEYLMLDLNKAVEAHKECETTLPFVRVINMAADDIDQIHDLEKKALIQTDSLQQAAWAPISDKDKTEFRAIVKKLVQKHRFSMIEGDLLNQIIAKGKPVMKIRGAFAKYTAALKDRLTAEEQDKPIRILLDEHQHEHETAKQAWGKRGSLVAANGIEGEAVEAHHVLRLSRKKLEWENLQSGLGAADESDEDVFQIPKKLMDDLQDVIKTFEHEGLLGHKEAHTAIELLDGDDRFVVYAIFKYMDDLAALTHYLRRKGAQKGHRKRSQLKIQNIQASCRAFNLARNECMDHVQRDMQQQRRRVSTALTGSLLPDTGSPAGSPGIPKRTLLPKTPEGVTAQDGMEMFSPASSTRALIGSASTSSLLSSSPSQGSTRSMKAAMKRASIKMVGEFQKKVSDVKANLEDHEFVEKIKSGTFNSGSFLKQPSTVDISFPDINIP